MKLTSALLSAAILVVAAPAAAATAPTDPQIAHIAYTAGNLDIAAAKQALAKSKNKAVREFAEEMVRDHEAVNAKALALVKKLHSSSSSTKDVGTPTGTYTITVTGSATVNGASVSRQANIQLVVVP